MRSKLIVLLAVLTVLAVNPVVIATVEWNDGASHIINTPLFDSVLLDEIVANNPGTHVDMVWDGWVTTLLAYNNSTIAMMGGVVDLRLRAYDNSTITMTDGIVGYQLAAYNDSTVTVSGGRVYEGIRAYNNSTVAISGGDVYGFEAFHDSIITMSGGSAIGFAVRTNGTIYLDGTDFEIDGTPLVNGDKLSDFVTFDTRRDYYNGIITGILSDGTELNSNFFIYNTDNYAGTADIYIIPEPTTLLLLGLGGLVLRKRKA